MADSYDCQNENQYSKKVLFSKPIEFMIVKTGKTGRTVRSGKKKTKIEGKNFIQKKTAG